MLIAIVPFATNMHSLCLIFNYTYTFYTYDLFATNYVIATYPEDMIHGIILKNKMF